MSERLHLRHDRVAGVGFDDGFAAAIGIHPPDGHGNWRIPWLQIPADDVDVGTPCTLFRRIAGPLPAALVPTHGRWSCVDIVPGHVVNVTRCDFGPAPAGRMLLPSTGLTIDETRKAQGFKPLPPTLARLTLSQIQVRNEDDAVVRDFGVSYDVDEGPMRVARFGCPRRGGFALVVGKLPHVFTDLELSTLIWLTTTSIR